MRTDTSVVLLLVVAVTVCFLASAVHADVFEPSPTLTRSPYAVLGIPDGASAADVRAAFKQKTMELSPDKNPGLDRAVGRKQFAEVFAAYNLLMSKEAEAFSQSRRPAGDL